MSSSTKRTPKARPPSFGSACAGTIVAIIVGPEQKKRMIHKALLVHHSEYFRKALAGPWQEAEEDIVRLEDVDPSAIDIFGHWLYTGQIPEPRDRTEWIDIVGETKDSLFHIQVMAYALADRLLVTKLQHMLHNSIVDYVKTAKRYWGPAGSKTLRWAQQAFENMPADRPLLQLLVDTHCNSWKICCDDLGADLSKFPPAFLARFARRLVDMYRHEHGQRDREEHCYYNHVDETEEKACDGIHMRYDTEKGTGYFGEKTRCFSCRVSSTRDAMPENSDEASILEREPCL